ncbi:MAG: hypothetical protein M3188_02190 [Actinomycetota bacterium]|nr:hypothetical protein [Actinomycetota bacterium]
MASVSEAVPVRLRDPRLALFALAASAPAILLLARLLPAEGPVVGLRLAAAYACVLVLPGALLVRALAWPVVPAIAACASLALSLAVAFVAFAVTFAVGAPLTVTIGLVAVAVVAAAVPAARARPEPAARVELVILAAVVVAGLVFAGLVWWVNQTLGTGDVLMHLARSRKLAEADVLSSVAVANEYADGGLHPGYAFPLWHGIVALVAHLAGVDVAAAMLHGSALLVPLAFVVAYGAGRALFRSWGGGVAVLAAQVAQLGFSRGGVGSFDSLSLPASATRILLVPALLALVFAFLGDGRRRGVVAIAAAALAVAVVHPTYLIFAAIPLAGFAVLWLSTRRPSRQTATRLVAALGALVIPGVLFFLWLLPVVTSTASHAPNASEVERALAHYGAQLEVVGDGYRAAPEAITRAGPVVVAGLLAVPLLAVFVRRIWAAFAVGGMLVVLAVLLVPELFGRFSDLVSISQSRRLAQFLPIPFAIAGAAALLGRGRLAGLAAAFAGALALELLYETDVSHRVERGGPVWPLWVAIGGGLVGLAAAVVLRRRQPPAELAPWTAAVALVFAAPIAVAGLAEVDRSDTPDREALTPALVGALERADPDDVVFAPVHTSYRVAAFVNVKVATTPPPHAADTQENRPYRRQRDVIRFFSPRSGLSDAGRADVLAEYGADWLVVDRAAPYPKAFVRRLRPVHRDSRYLLYRVGDAA